MSENKSSITWESILPTGLSNSINPIPDNWKGVGLYEQIRTSGTTHPYSQLSVNDLQEALDSIIHNKEPDKETMDRLVHLPGYVRIGTVEVRCVLHKNSMTAYVSDAEGLILMPLVELPYEEFIRWEELPEQVDDMSGVPDVKAYLDQLTKEGVHSVSDFTTAPDGNVYQYLGDGLWQLLLDTSNAEANWMNSITTSAKNQYLSMHDPTLPFIKDPTKSLELKYISPDPADTPHYDWNDSLIHKAKKYIKQSYQNWK